MLLTALLTALCVETYALGQTLSSHSAPIIDLDYAVYEGVFNQTTNTTSFLGIRYAAPPVGKLRFQAPARPLDERRLGVQKANLLPTGCPQASFGMNESTPFKSGDSNNFIRRQSTNPEDCLFVNAWVPGRLKPNAKLPVLVWIHGGGYVSGDIQSTTGDDVIIKAGGGLIVVTFDYRLGVFGFLAGAQVKQKGALNAGLLDQNAVLEWVQKNIHHFGGNPDEVTIWGESAGAGSVLQHMIAHAGNTQPPLFKAAITSSTFLPSQYKFDNRIYEQIYSELVERTGYVKADTSVLVHYSLMTATANQEIIISGFFGTFVTVPVIDGEFIQSSPTQQIASGILNGDRFLAIINTFEGTVFVNESLSVNMTISDYVSQLFPELDDKQINAIAAQYTNISTLDIPLDKDGAIMGESIFICPTYLVLQSFAGTAFKAEFAIPPGTHGCDIPYYFPRGAGTPPPFEVFSNPEFTASFAGAIAGFAKFGDPNVHPVSGIITPHWKPFSDGHSEMLFNRTEDFQPDIRSITTDQALLERCAFWKSIAGPAGQ
ncbi:cephalosporin esterase [Irpex rosettiformis]|uniref:Cephalosporin esterase n=1 Tax=Irpex rosettiformis TaxID=378272 RepID=A0ACB8UIX1_9APHY|nr:cephalosporin esterase [Irpex rosettiformis]